MAIRPHDHQSYVARLRAILTARAAPEDPWFAKLRCVKGRVGSDRVERLSTGHLFELLGLHPFERTPEAGKRVRSMMVALNWTPVRARCATTRGHASRVRGYARRIDHHH